ncbi:MAG: hypothetical protein ED557_14120 [Balneola sp.]|nr:MAG: hypothetical protein ED557_14120 [Balneola sp.]
MGDDFHFFKTKMPNTRRADYYLGCLDGSIFLDFNRSPDNRISLVRISFDGFGCCGLDESSIELSSKNSQDFISEMEKESLDQKVISELVYQIINANREHIWPEAIKEYGLLKKE